MRKRASTYTDGGMLWWVPPTSLTLELRVEKSKSRHALETTQLRSTCILGKNTSEFRAYATTVDFFSPFRESKNEKKKGKLPEIKSHLSCVQLFLVRDADERCALANGRILSCVSYPKCRDVALLTGAVHTALLPGGKSSSTPPTGKVRSAPLFDRPHPQRVEVQGKPGRSSNDVARARLLLLSDATSLLSHSLSLTFSPPYSQDLSIGYWGCCYCCCWITPYFSLSFRLSLSPPLMVSNTGQ